MDAGRLRVWVVAASSVTRRGLRSLLEEGEALRVVGESAHAEPGPEAEVIVYGDSPGRSPLLEGGPGRVYLLERGAALPPLESGVALLAEDAGAPELEAAVLAVALGLAVLSPALLERLNLTPAVERDPLEGELTAREREVLTLLSDGLPNKGIAKRLSISEHTVKFHLGQIFSKLGVRGRSEAVGVAIRRGWVSL